MLGIVLVEDSRLAGDGELMANDLPESALVAADDD
jgi:hypothetical protein